MNVRVLAVEDSRTQAEALRSALEVGGYAVTLARSGDQALELLKTEIPDVVISDVVMPGAVDGYELCRRIKSGERKDIPVVLLTSLSDPMDIIRGLEVGADNFLTKPYDADHLLERLGVLLTTRQARSRGRVRAGVSVYFMGREFRITSEREQILDLLVATFEDAVRQNRELREREQELTLAKEHLARYAGTLQEQLQDIIDNSPAVIYVKDVDGRYELVNRQFERLFGLERSVVRGQTDEDLPPEVAASFGANDRWVLEADSVLEFDEVAALEDGDHTYLSVKFPLRHHAGETYGVCGIATDITERKRAEEAVKDSEARYRMLFDKSPHPLWVFDAETLRFLAVNDAAVRHYGYSRAEFLAMKIPDIRPAEDVPRLAERLREGISGFAPAEVWRHRRKDGSVIDVEITAHDVALSGRPARLVLATDVTERRRAEQALWHRARQQAAVAQLGQTAIEVSELDALLNEAVALVARTLEVEYVRVLELQSGGRALLLRAGIGWEGSSASVPADPGSSQAGYTLSVGEPVMVHDFATEGRFHDPALLEERITSGMSVVVGGRARAYGVLGVHTAEARLFRLDDAHFLQAIANVLAAAIERDRAERALSQSQRLEAVGRLAGGVAHDFNNLLTVISGSADFALEDLPPESAARGDIEEIRRAAARAAGLTRQLLAFSRRQVLQPVVLSVNSVVTDLDTMLRRLISEDIDYRTVLDPGLGQVKADPGQIEQVIVNLVVNARDAMPRGGKLVIETANVELDATFTDQHVGAEPGRHVMLAVTDTGEGMDRETLARIFEPFFTTKGERGTGLGLATVYGIVKQSGGSVWVYSELEHGTTFKIYLPMVEGTATAWAKEVTAPSGGSETVLFVEDDDAVRGLGERMLRSAGFQVLAARSGKEALNILAGHEGPLHLLVTDMVMPQMRGPDLAEEVLQRHPEARILFLSGYTDPAFLAHPLLRRGTPFLQKPFAADTLVRKVSEVLNAPRQA